MCLRSWWLERQEVMVSTVTGMKCDKGELPCGLEMITHSKNEVMVHEGWHNGVQSWEDFLFVARPACLCLHLGPFLKSCHNARLGDDQLPAKLLVFLSALAVLLVQSLLANVRNAAMTFWESFQNGQILNILRFRQICSSRKCSLTWTACLWHLRFM